MTRPIESATAMPIRLSICMATFRRAAFIAETLQCILDQADDRTEVVVVDGASPDDTPVVVSGLQARYPRLAYYREQTNAGVDRDFDKAVEYARGEYCWLMSDDDILVPDAIRTVLAALADEPELVVVNAEVRNTDLSEVLKPNQLGVSADREFDAQEHRGLFVAAGSYLSFIGGVVIRRTTWLARDRAPYYGSLFIHMGVLFQPPVLGRARIIARPLIQIRYGNAMWTARGFEIWIAKWPALVWSFAHFDETARRHITPRDPAASLKTLLWYRAIGAYGPAEYEELLAGGKRPHHPLARLVAGLPARAVNAAVALYCVARGHGDARLMLYDLVRANCASSLTRWAAR